MGSMSLILPPSIIGANYVTVDDLLLYMGEFGFYQKYLFIMCMPFCCFLAFVAYSQIFITLTPEEHWCKLPKTNMSVENLRKLAIPSAEKVPHEGHQLPYSRCWIYDLPIEKILQSESPEKDWPMKKCSNWDFNFTVEDVPYSTIATELYWVCDDAILPNLAQSIFFVGSIIGGFFFGWLADKYGRIPALIGVNFLGFFGGFVTIFCKNFWQFSLCRFILGFSYDNVFVLMYILVLEYVGPKWRTFVGNMSFGIFFSMSCLTMAWMAYYISNWRIYCLATSVPLLFIIFVPWLIPESARWLMSRGKLEKAIQILTRIEKSNKAAVPADLYEDFIDEAIKVADELKNESYSFLDLFKTPRLRLFTVLLTVSWSIMELTYDGHIRCLDSLGLDVFTTFTIGAAMEFPAQVVLISTLDYLGRKWCLVGSMVFSGMASFGAVCVPIGIYFASFAMIGRFFINIATSVGLQYASELLPTVVRGVGVSFIHNVGSFSAILSPFVAYTSKFQYNLPMSILGTISIFAGFLCLFLPETLKEQLPQTLMEGEQFGKDQKFCFNPWMHRKVQIGSTQHHLHAKRPAYDSALLRSSMVSGNTGNSLRFQAIRNHLRKSGTNVINADRAETSRSPLEYLRMLRENEKDKIGSRKSSEVINLEDFEVGTPGTSRLKEGNLKPEKKKKVAYEKDVK